MGVCVCVCVALPCHRHIRALENEYRYPTPHPPLQYNLQICCKKMKMEGRERGQGGGVFVIDLKKKIIIKRVKEEPKGRERRVVSHQVSHVPASDSLESFFSLTSSPTPPPLTPLALSPWSRCSVKKSFFIQQLS